MSGDVVVVGGGIVGLACAWRAARRGAAVTVVDPAPGEGASHAAAGMLAPATEVHLARPEHAAFQVAGARRWPAFAEELEATAGRPVGLRATGTLVVARDADDRAVLDRLVDLQRDLGLDVERLTRGACRDREPELHPAVAGGVLARDDHQVDPRAVVAALRSALQLDGVVTVRDTVAEVRHDGARVRGVVLTDGGHHPAATVVLAAGAAAGRIGGLPGSARPPVRGVKGQILRLRSRDGDPVLTGVVRGLSRGVPVYLVPRGDGRVVVGATEEDVGEDRVVTAGGLRALLEAAADLVPATDELELQEATARPRPATPDGAPVIGHAELEGLLLATGHHRGGVLLAPLTAEAVVDLLEGRAPDPTLAVADPTRPSLHRSS
ncbi:glycine oxidase ThiO [Nitriliruptoraceae bacterium ZYF776]|nr:glycine oxidase ThiO [Profundirhabdus halotolerans]